MHCVLYLSGAVYVPSQAMVEDADAAAAPSPGRAARSLSERGDLELTPRQGQVLALMMRGRSNKDICRELGLAERTVKLHVTAGTQHAARFEPHASGDCRLEAGG